MEFKDWKPDDLTLKDIFQSVFNTFINWSGSSLKVPLKTLYRLPVEIGIRNVALF